MAKRFRLRICRILQSCLSKDPSSLPSNPVPSFLRLHKPNLLCPAPPHLRHRVSSASTCDQGPKFQWEQEDKYWHVVAADSPRRKIYNSSAPENDAVSAFPPLKSKKKRRVGKKKTTGRFSVSSVSNRKVRESLAVVKRSEDPKEDFKRSMREMIVEKEMYEEEELEQLLHCFLSLNSRHHRGLIVQAFTEIWEAVLRTRPHLVQSV